MEDCFIAETYFWTCFSSSFAGKNDSKKTKKQLQISIGISSADLKTKAHIAREISKKNP